MKYNVVSAGRFYDCGEESTVYFDELSGDTHLVSDFAAHIIRLLEKQPMDMDALKEKLSADVDADDDEQLATVIPDILAQLVDLEVIERQ